MAVMLTPPHWKETQNESITTQPYDYDVSIHELFTNGVDEHRAAANGIEGSLVRSALSTTPLPRRATMKWRTRLRQWWCKHHWQDRTYLVVNTPTKVQECMVCGKQK